jgi:hypothetical protein
MAAVGGADAHVSAQLLTVTLSDSWLIECLTVS